MSILIKPENLSLDRYEHIGLGSFRSVYRIPENSEKFQNYSGMVLKLPILGNPDSVKANELEYAFYKRSPNYIRKNLASVEKYSLDERYLIMEYVENLGKNQSVEKDLKSRIREVAKPGLSMQSDLDLSKDNFGMDSQGVVKLIDYPFRVKKD